jgi:hypothetical protein
LLLLLVSVAGFHIFSDIPAVACVLAITGIPVVVGSLLLVAYLILLESDADGIFRFLVAGTRTVAVDPAVFLVSLLLLAKLRPYINCVSVVSGVGTVAVVSLLLLGSLLLLASQKILYN